MLENLPPPLPKIAREDLSLKSSVRFTPPPPKSSGKMEDLLLKSSVQFTPPPEIAFISNFLAPKIDIN